MVRQGEIYWIDLGEPEGSEPGFRRPYVVVQNDAFNQSRIRTTVVCALTSNLKRAQAPGNVLLQTGEGHLPTESVVNVTQIYTVDKDILTESIGLLSTKRVSEIVAGLKLMLEPVDLT